MITIRDGIDEDGRRRVASRVTLTVPELLAIFVIGFAIGFVLERLA